MQHHYTGIIDFREIEELADIDLILAGNGAHETESHIPPDSPAPNPAEAVAFVERHFCPSPDGHFGGHILLWTRDPVTDERGSTWFRTLTEFRAFIEAQVSNLSKLEVYIGMAVSSPEAQKGKELTRYNRLNNEAAGSITSLWQDLDTIDGHVGDTKGKTYFRDLDALMNSIPSLPLPPSELVCSGNGVQVYWRLSERLDIEPERQRVVNLLDKWQRKVRNSLKPFTVDSVADLARVFRLPGFLNNKDRDHPKPVRSLMSDGPTYTVAEIEALLPEGPPQRETQARSKSKASQGKPASHPATAGMTDADWDHLAISIENAPPAKQARARFDAIWGGHRTDMSDRSGSGYDLALANLLASIGWTREEIKPALVERRRVAVEEGREAPNPKPNSYYDLTLSKVKIDEDVAEEGSLVALPEEDTAEEVGEKAEVAAQKSEEKPEKKADKTARTEAAVMAHIAEIVDSHRLIYWMDRFYEQRGNWEVQSARVIERRLREAVGVAQKIRHPLIGTATAASWMKALEMAVMPPCEDTAILHESDRWGSYHLDTGGLVEGTAFKNCLISIDAGGNILTRQPNLREFFALARPYDLPAEDPGRPPLFDGWLEEKFPDEKTRQALWECIGGTILQRMAGDEKVVFLKGPGGTGKGTLARVIDALVGPGQTWEVTSPSRLASSQFALSQAPWSAVLRITDMPRIPSREGSGRDVFNAGMGILKSMSGSDGVAVEKKNQDQRSAKTHLSIWINTNYSITAAISDDDGSAWDRRVILIPTTQSIPDHRQQPKFFERFLPELAQIAWAAVHAYAATVQRGFTRSLEMVEAIEAERGDRGVVQRKALTEQINAYIASLPKGAEFKTAREELKDGLRAALGGVPPDEKTVKDFYAGIRALPGVTETRSGSDRRFKGIGLPGDMEAVHLRETPQEIGQDVR